MDQRFVDGRTDVLTYMSEPLTEAAAGERRAGGEPVCLDQRQRQRLGGEAD
jgi:hypothetical protein